MSVRLPDSALERLRNAKRVAVMTGAGISAESGIPTFRDAQTGLWAKYDPADLATPEAFQRDPKLVWRWYQWRRELVGRAAPNAGHSALAALERRLGDRFRLITQNVDGLHARAGSERVLPLHGDITRDKCFDHGHPMQSSPEDEQPPACPECGSLARPGVVWFGESLPEETLLEAIEWSRTADVFLSVGTSSVVQPAASLAHEALRNQALLIEVNLADTPLSGQALILRGAAGEVLPRLVEQLDEDG